MGNMIFSRSKSSSCELDSESSCQKYSINKLFFIIQSSYIYCSNYGLSGFKNPRKNIPLTNSPVSIQQKRLCVLRTVLTKSIKHFPLEVYVKNISFKFIKI